MEKRYEKDAVSVCKHVPGAFANPQASGSFCGFGWSWNKMGLPRHEWPQTRPGNLALDPQLSLTKILLPRNTISCQWKAHPSGSGYLLAGFGLPHVWEYVKFWASLVAQMVKKPSAMRETWVWSQSREDPLKKGMATHLPGKSQGQNSPVGYRPWRSKESDMTEWCEKCSKNGCINMIPFTQFTE